ncbi:BolA family protein [Ehrlichia chaffeensis]|nr:BolA family protein [Ehrlichia chaffeensis]AHX05311.1 bolA-like family protein [Ehrlichia chaffeensis str. Jax]
MDIIQKIGNKITSSLNVLKLEITDESQKHKGHNFHSISNISHLKIQVVSNDFLEVSQINRHKLLHKVLENEIKLIHSISFLLYTEVEYNKLL